MDKKLEVDISRIFEKISEIERTYKSIERYLESIHKDREILLEIQGSIAHQKSLLVSNHNHQDDLANNIKTEVSDKVLEVKDSIADKTMLVKSNNKGVFDKLRKLFAKEVKQ